ncbi:tetracycline-efflux transporter [Planoprotostelium fungivorum]|uniref:Tetracycline-efflux transporter n=1 Tax=Planoprotostelium fungivorum TaxID=1890364 RepID=A0A2P6MZZ6_9EUKA|nr:tetracycline-efflux transporter [Planoprotostelium fungivorum]
MNEPPTTQQPCTSRCETCTEINDQHSEDAAASLSSQQCTKSINNDNTFSRVKLLKVSRGQAVNNPKPQRKLQSDRSDESGTIGSDSNTNSSINDERGDREYDDTKPLLGQRVPEVRRDGKKKHWYRPRMMFLMAVLTVHFIGFGFSGSMGYLRMVEIFQQEGYVGKYANTNATVFNGYLGSIRNAGTFVMSPIHAALSDRVGRKPMLVASVLAQSLGYGAYIYGTPRWIFFVTSSIGAVTDGMHVVALTSMLDVTPAHRRAFGFAMFGMGMGISRIGWPALAGWVSDEYGYRVVFFVALSVNALVLLMLIAMPETRPKESIKKWDWSSLIPLRDFFLLLRSVHTIVLCILIMLLSFSLEGVIETQASWIKYVFPHQTNFWIGTLSSAAGVGMILMVPIVRFLVPMFGKKKAVCLGLILGTSGLACYTFVTNWWYLYPLTLLRSFGYLTNPTLQAMLCSHYLPEEQSLTIGVLSSLKTIDGVIGPLIFAPLFSHFTTTAPEIPGIVYYVVGCINLLTLTISVIYFVFVRTPKSRISEIKPVSKVWYEREEEEKKGRPKSERIPHGHSIPIYTSQDFYPSGSVQ